MITAWSAHRASDGYFILTDDRDCLPPDAIGSIVRHEYSDQAQALACVQRVLGPYEFQVGNIYAVRDA